MFARANIERARESSLNLAPYCFSAVCNFVCQVWCQGTCQKAKAETLRFICRLSTVSVITNNHHVSRKFSVSNPVESVDGEWNLKSLTSSSVIISSSIILVSFYGWKLRANTVFVFSTMDAVCMHYTSIYCKYSPKLQSFLRPAKGKPANIIKHHNDHLVRLLSLSPSR